MKVKPIYIGGHLHNNVGKSLTGLSEETSGSTLFKRVGSTTLKITNSAGKTIYLNSNRRNFYFNSSPESRLLLIPD